MAMLPRMKQGWDGEVVEPWCECTRAHHTERDSFNPSNWLDGWLLHTLHILYCHIRGLQSNPGAPFVWDSVTD